MIAIPNYEIMEKVAEGPQATIYKALDKRNPDHLVALKVLTAAVLSDYKKSQFSQKIEHLREKLVGTDFSDYFTEPEDARKGYEQVFSKGFVTDYPLTIRHKDGRLTSVLYNASVYRDVTGNVLGVFAAARDVTAQKEAEAKIAEQRAREEERARELDRLAELERFQKLTVGRELKMIELKKEIEELQKQIVMLQKSGQIGRSEA